MNLKSSTRSTLTLCFFVLLSIAFIAVSKTTAASSSEHTTVGLTMLRWQAGSPAQMIGTTMSGDIFLKDSMILNTSKSKLTQINLGCVLVGQAQGDSQPHDFKVMISEPIQIAIEPSDVGSTGPLAWSMQEIIKSAKAAQVNNVEVFIGIVGAQFENGEVFTYDLQSEMKFVEQPDEQIDNLYALVYETKIAKINRDNQAKRKQGQSPRPMGVGYWKCVDQGLNASYCNNTYDDCKTSPCPNRDRLVLTKNASSFINSSASPQTRH